MYSTATADRASILQIHPTRPAKMKERKDTKRGKKKEATKKNDLMVLKKETINEVVVHEALCCDMAQGRMNGAPTREGFLIQACKLYHHPRYPERINEVE